MSYVTYPVRERVNCSLSTVQPVNDVEYFLARDELPLLAVVRLVVGEEVPIPLHQS
jgi:hypothetical protein